MQANNGFFPRAALLHRTLELFLPPAGIEPTTYGLEIRHRKTSCGRENIHWGNKYASGEYKCFLLGQNPLFGANLKKESQ